MKLRHRLGPLDTILLALALASPSPHGAARAAAPTPATAGDSTASPARSVAVATVAAAESAAAPTGGPPSPAEIAILRGRMDHHVARVQLRLDAYDIRGATFDAGGVSFGPGAARGVPRWEREGRSGTLALPGPLASPVGWDRIDFVIVRKPCGTRGALVGGVAGAAAYATILAVFAEFNSSESGMGALVLLPLPAVGALVGAGFGSLVVRSEPGWERAGAARPGLARSTAIAPGPAGAALPRGEASAAPPPTMLGILGADLASRPVRLWIGPDGYEIRRVRLEPGGVAFDTGDLRELPSRAAGATGGDAPRLAPPASPIGWDRLDCIETRRPSGRRGAAWGMVLLPATILVAEMATGDRSGNALGGAVLICAPVGALIGAGVGQFVPHSEREWERSAPEPAAHR